VASHLQRSSSFGWRGPEFFAEGAGLAACDQFHEEGAVSTRYLEKEVPQEPAQWISNRQGPAIHLDV